MMADDMTLLQEYARHNSEEAFATLVSRHVNLVYSVALMPSRSMNTWNLIPRRAGYLFKSGFTNHDN